MAFTLPLIGDLADLGLNDFQIGPGNARKIRGYVRTNLGAGDALIDTTNQVTLLGDTPITILSNGTWSVDLLDTSSTDLNVEANTLQYELVVEYTSTGSPAKRVYRSGWFALTEADLELVDDVPMAVFSSLDLDLPSVTPSWRSAFAAEMEAIRDETAVISGLTGEDAAVALLIDTPASDTATSLAAAIAADVPTVGADYFAPRSPAVEALHADLATGTRDVDVIIHGDSTADATDEWFARAFDTLAAQYPAYTLHHRLWSDTNQNYSAPTVLQTGAVARVDGYAEFDATTTKYLSTPDAAAVSITGDIDIRVKVALDDWTPAADQAFAAKYHFGGQRSWRFYINTSGAPKFEWSEDGTALKSVTATANMGTTPAAEARWLRVTLDVDNGAAGNDAKFYWSNDGITWSQLGTTVTTAGVTSIFDNAYPMEVGSRSLGGADPMDGKFYRLLVFASLTEADRRVDLDMNSYLGGGTTVTGYTGETWTANGGASMVARTGAPILTLWNGSASGRAASYQSDATRFPKMAPPGRPVRLAFISHSHNENGNTQYAATWKALADLLLARYPQAGMVAVLQNARKSPASWINEHAERLSQVRALAGRHRWDVLDAYTPTLADLATLVHTDGIHPSAAGQTAWTGLAEDYLGV